MELILPTNIYTRFADLFCTFRDFTDGKFFSTWTWKLDPYLTSGIEEKDCHLVIDKSIGTGENISEKHLLEEERTGFFSRQVHRREDGGTIWSYIRTRSGKRYLQYTVSPTWDKITLLEDNTETRGQIAFEYLGLIFPYIALKHDMLTFHGALVECEGNGFIVSAPSGTGKTTHARLWRDYKNALIINGDRVTCKKEDGSWKGYGLPWSGSSGEQIARKVPLKALIILEQGMDNKVRRMTPKESFGEMLPHIQCPAWDSEMVGKAMELTDEFLQQIPVLHFSCRPDLDAVETLYRALKEI